MDVAASDRGLERQRGSTSHRYLSMHYWCEEKMATCVRYETETDNRLIVIGSSEIAGRPTSASNDSQQYPRDFV